MKIFSKELTIEQVKGYAKALPDLAKGSCEGCLAVQAGVELANTVEAYEKEISELQEKNKKLSEVFLEMCCHECHGDSSVGEPDCPFYKYPDCDEFGKQITSGGCTLKNTEESK